jgi:SAM-dependent methyltransferase
VRTVSRTYDALASRWDDWSARVVPDLREEWARKIEPYVNAGERVVELGCGTGQPVGRLLSGAYGYVGVDASAGMLSEARAASVTRRLVCADMRDVNFRAHSLGAVVVFFSISHTPRDGHAQLVERIASWLRPGGVFVGNISSRDDPDDIEDLWLDAGPMRWSGFDTEHNVAMLTSAGFRVVDSATIELTEPDGATIRPLWFVARREPEISLT